MTFGGNRRKCDPFWGRDHSAIVLKRLDYCNTTHHITFQSAKSHDVGATRPALTTLYSASHHLQSVRFDAPDTYADNSPSYLSNLVILPPQASNPESGSDQPVLIATIRSQLRLKFGEHCFSHAGHKARKLNTLPGEIQYLTYIDTFKRKL